MLQCERSLSLKCTFKWIQPNLLLTTLALFLSLFNPKCYISTLCTTTATPTAKQNTIILYILAWTSLASGPIKCRLFIVEATTVFYKPLGRNRHCIPSILALLNMCSSCAYLKISNKHTPFCMNYEFRTKIVQMHCCLLKLFSTINVMDTK